MKCYIIIIAQLILVGNVFSQVPSDYEASPFFAPADSQKLMVHIGNKNFFKNNEYFNPLNEGLTLPGVIIEPTLIYYPGSTTRIEGGVSFLKYFGKL